MFRRSPPEPFPLVPLPPDDPFATKWARENEVFYEGLGLMDWDEYQRTIWESDRARAVRRSMCFLCPTSERLFVVASDGSVRAIELTDIAGVEVVPPPNTIPGRRREGLIRIRSKAGDRKEENLSTRLALAHGVATTLSELARRPDSQPSLPLSEKDAYQKEALGLYQLPAFRVMRGMTQSGEDVFALTMAEAAKDTGSVNTSMVITDRRMIWTASDDAAKFRDLWFDDVVALAVRGPVTTEGASRPLIIEADDPRFDDLSGQATTTVVEFRFISPSAERIADHVYDQSPSESRSRQPDVSGAGLHRGLGKRRESISIESPVFVNVLHDLFDRGEWTPSLKLIVPERPDQRETLPPPPVAAWKLCPACQGQLKTVKDASECLDCRRVWCDPERQPELDDDGKLIGTQFRFPIGTDVETDEWRRVASFVRGPREDPAPIPDERESESNPTSSE